MMNLAARTLPLLLVAGAAALTVSCNAASSLREPDEYLGCATDENWRTFDDYELTGMVKLDDAQAPKMTGLNEGMTLSGATPNEFKWQLSPTSPGKPTGSAS